MPPGAAGELGPLRVFPVRLRVFHAGMEGGEGGWCLITGLIRAVVDSILSLKRNKGGFLNFFPSVSRRRELCERSVLGHSVDVGVCHIA